MQTMGSVFPALVIDTNDPEALGRVKITLPDSDGGEFQGWARVATWSNPDIGTEVLVAFEAADTPVPYVIGSLWNGQNRSSVTLETPAGQRITLQDGAGPVTISDSNGNSISLGPAGIGILSSSKVTINSALLEINAGTAEIHGLLKADTVIASTVINAAGGNVW